MSTAKRRVSETAVPHRPAESVAEPAATSWSHHRARIAALTRSRPQDDPELLDERRKLTEANLQREIERAVAAWPPLTQSQRSRLRSLLESS